MTPVNLLNELIGLRYIEKCFRDSLQPRPISLQFDANLNIAVITFETPYPPPSHKLMSKKKARVH